MSYNDYSKEDLEIIKEMFRNKKGTLSLEDIKHNRIRWRIKSQRNC